MLRVFSMRGVSEALPETSDAQHWSSASTTRAVGHAMLSSRKKVACSARFSPRSRAFKVPLHSWPRVASRLVLYARAKTHQLVALRAQEDKRLLPIHVDHRSSSGHPRRADRRGSNSRLVSRLDAHHRRPHDCASVSALPLSAESNLSHANYLTTCSHSPTCPCPC